MAESQKGAGGQGEELPIKRSDIVLERVAIKRRWHLSDEQRENMANKAYTSFMQADDERAISGLGKLLATMEAQNQADEHLADKNNRLDNNKPTAITQVRVVDDTD
jgi:hypothetical protein